MSTLKTNAITSRAGSNLNLSGDSGNVVDIEAGFLVGGVAGIGTASLQDDAVTLAKMADDSVGVAQLSATGTASSSVFLRGDNSWAAAGGAGAWKYEATLTTSWQQLIATEGIYKVITGETEGGLSITFSSSGSGELTPDSGKIVQFDGNAIVHANAGITNCQECDGEVFISVASDRVCVWSIMNKQNAGDFRITWLKYTSSIPTYIKKDGGADYKAYLYSVVSS